MEKGERRRGIQSVEIGLRVLDALVGLGKASPLSAIAQASDMSASQAHRYLASLTVAGMAQQDAASGRYDVGPAALRLALPDRPTAIFACNDDMAAAAITIAHQCRINVPAELTICGFDDTPLASSIWPPLTTIRQPIREMNRKS